MAINTFPLVLEDAYWITPTVKHFVFHSTMTPPFNYLPGQFITVQFEREGQTLRRSYSIANAPTQNNRIEFAAGYREGGPGTEFLFNLTPSESITVMGPFGRLILKNEIPKRYILIATSTGITPYRAMIPSLTEHLHTNPSLSIVIIQGVQTQEDVLYEADFAAFAAKHPQVQVRKQLSQAKEIDPSKQEYRGHAQLSFPDLALNPTEDLVYLCGNPSMIDEAFTLLTDQGFATQRIIREKYISK